MKAMKASPLIKVGKGNRKNRIDKSEQLGLLPLRDQFDGFVLVEGTFAFHGPVTVYSVVDLQFE